MTTPPPDSSPARALGGTALTGDADWRTQIDEVSRTMAALSRETDPARTVKLYREVLSVELPRDRLVSVSRRGLERPWYRLTRSSLGELPSNPWTSFDELPRFDHGLLGELLWSGEARVIGELEVAEDDPCRAHFEGMRSAICLPAWDDGDVLNMTILLRRAAEGYDPAMLPRAVLQANLVGRTTKALVLRKELDAAYQRLDQELKVVADIQRSLLPKRIPELETLDLATHYEPSRYAGGDYFDFFELEDDRLGILVADVCGHGTPAAVLMAITHSLAHTFTQSTCCPGELLRYVNRNLAERYVDGGTFVTAFFGIYDGAERTLTYSSAGHNPPRLKRCSDGSLMSLDGGRSLPLGIVADVPYEADRLALVPGDQIIFYTDGITEARGPGGGLFGVERLDEVLENCSISAQGLIDATLDAVADFTDGRPADDDRTMVVARCR